MLSLLFVSLFALLLGLAFCFFGYRVFLVMLPIWGFFAGFWLGADVTTVLFGAGFLATTTGWLVGFFAGLLGALFSYLFYLFGVAFIAAGFGWALGSGFMAVLGFQPGLFTGLVALAAAAVMIFLVLGLNLQKYVIIAMTAVGGANAIVLSGLLLLGRVGLESLSSAGNAIQPVVQDSWFWLLVWLAVAVAGIVMQIRTNQTYQFSRDQYVEAWG